jgi:hypothetical protein
MARLSGGLGNGGEMHRDRKVRLEITVEEWQHEWLLNNEAGISAEQSAENVLTLVMLDSEAVERTERVIN